MAKRLIENHQEREFHFNFQTEVDRDGKKVKVVLPQHKYVIPRMGMRETVKGQPREMVPGTVALPSEVVKAMRADDVAKHWFRGDRAGRPQLIDKGEVDDDGLERVLPPQQAQNKQGGATP